MGLTQKESHASAIAVILPLTAISAAIYINTEGNFFSSPALYSRGACRLADWVIYPPQNSRKCAAEDICSVYALGGIRMVLR
jgi:hypothetical protein